MATIIPFPPRHPEPPRQFHPVKAAVYGSVFALYLTGWAMLLLWAARTLMGMVS